MSPFFLGILGSTLQAVGFLLLGGSSASAIGWISTILFVAFIADKRSTILESLFVGAVVQSIGFCWLWDTITDISKLNSVGVGIFFLLYIFVNSLQYGLFLFLYRNLPEFLNKFALKSAIAWAVIEGLHLRIFPWLLGHTQFAFKPFIQIAELAGVILISFFMFWICELLYKAIIDSKSRVFAIYATVLFFSICIFGYIRISHFKELDAKNITVAAIQSGQQHNSDNSATFGTYKPLTDGITETVDLAVWGWIDTLYEINESVFHLKNEGALPKLDNPINLLIGLNTYRRPNKKFKSAMLIEKDGSIPLPYHKRHFIPFGEYIPYEQIFPWLRHINPNAGAYNRGIESKVFTITLADNSKAKIGPVICYEATLNKYVIETVKAGAEVLVAISNDAWNGTLRDLPTNQHNVITQFSAIENRRAFVRVTKQGITSIVSPTGEILSQKRDMGAGVVVAKVPLVSYQSLFVQIGHKLWDLLWVITFMIVFIVKIKKLL